MAEALKVNRRGEFAAGRVAADGGGLSASSRQLLRIRSGFGDFLHDVRVEMKQVNWPSRSDVWSTTIVVIVTVAFFAVFFSLTDTLLTRAANWLFHFVSH